MSTKNDIRNATLGAEKKFRRETVTIGEHEVEVRQPSIRSRKELINSVTNEFGEIDNMEFYVRAVIHCTYTLDTNERVFDETDYESIMEQPTGGWVDEIATKALDLINSGSFEGKLEVSSET